MTNTLEYTPAPTPTLQPRRISCGAAAVALAALVLVPGQWFTLHADTNPLDRTTAILLWVLPDILSPVLVVTATAIFALRQRRGSQFPAISTLVAAVLLLLARSTRAASNFFSTATLWSDSWHFASILLSLASYALILVLLIAASRALVAATRLLGHRSLGIVATLLLIPSMLYCLFITLYMCARLTMVLTGPDFIRLFAPSTFYHLLDLLAFLHLLWLSFIWTIFTIASLAIAKRHI